MVRREPHDPDEYRRTVHHSCRADYICYVGPELQPEHCDLLELKMVDRPLLFELVVCRFLGKRAYKAADSEDFAKNRNEWLRKVGRKILTEVDKLDTHDEHKKQLHLFAGTFRKELGRKEPNDRVLLYSALGLCAALLGLCSDRGAKFTSPVYSRTAEQYYTELILSGGDALQDYYDKKNVVEIRRKIIRSLKSEGIDDFHIGLTLNLSEYQVKKLRQ